MKQIELHGRMYTPVLRNGLLDMRFAVSYGPAGRGLLQLTVYVACQLFAAGSRGGQIHVYDINASRQLVPNTTSIGEQRRALELMALIVATQLDTDFKLRNRTVCYKKPKEI